jgi:hypothetical protein
MLIGCTEDANSASRSTKKGGGTQSFRLPGWGGVLLSKHSAGSGSAGQADLQPHRSVALRCRFQRRTVRLAFAVFYYRAKPLSIGIRVTHT